VLPESVLQELCAVESIADDSVVDGGQCRGHRIRVLFVVSKSGVSCSGSRSQRCGDAQRLMLGNSRRDVGFQKSGEFP